MIQTARSTLKLKMPVHSVAPALPPKQVVVIEKPALQLKTSNTKFTSDVKPNASNTKTPESKNSKKQIKATKERVLAEVQQEALKVKLAKWKAESKQILKFLQTKYPLCFSIPAKPLAIGIYQEVRALEKDHFSNQQIRRFFKRYCSDKRYKKLLVEGKQRFNLDGSPATLITKQEVPPKTNKFFKPNKS